MTSDRITDRSVGHDGWTMASTCRGRRLVRRFGLDADVAEASLDAVTVLVMGMVVVVVVVLLLPLLLVVIDETSRFRSADGPEE